jgi:hypothetical protein
LNCKKNIHPKEKFVTNCFTQGAPTQFFNSSKFNLARYGQHILLPLASIAFGQAGAGKIEGFAASLLIFVQPEFSARCGAQRGLNLKVI